MGKQMSTRLTSGSGKNKKLTPLGGVTVAGGGLTALVLIFVILGSTGTFNILTWLDDTFAATPEEVEPTTFDFLVLDYYSHAEVDDDDHTIYVYECDVEDLTDDEIDELTYADYAEAADKDSGEVFTPETDFIYWCKVNGSDLCEYWWIPTLGLNTVYVMNLTEDAGILCYSEPPSVTVANTDFDNWFIKVSALDASEGVSANVALDEGYLPYYSFETDANTYLVLRITLNVTASLSYCDFKSPYEFSEHVSTTYIYYEIDAVFLHEIEFEIDFGTGQGTTWDAASIQFGYGTAASFTQLDTQS